MTLATLTVFMSWRDSQVAHLRADCVALTNRPPWMGSPREQEVERVHDRLVRFRYVSRGRAIVREVRLCSRCGR